MSDVVSTAAGSGIGAVAVLAATWLGAHLSRRDAGAARLIAERDEEAKAWRRGTDSQIGALREDVNDIKVSVSRMKGTLDFLDPRR